MLVDPDERPDQEQAFKTFKNAESLDELLDLKGGESLVYAAVMLYPDMFVQLI